MSVYTQFISPPNEQPAIQTTRADPSAWAAADIAALESNQMVGQSFQHAIGTLSHALAESEKVDPLYAAQAKADFQIQYNKKFQDLRAGVTPNGDLQTASTKTFDQTALPFIKGAPNAATQRHLVESFIGMRTKAYNHANSTQQLTNYQHDLESFRNMSSGLMNMGLQEPSDGNINNLKTQIEQLSTAMKEKGYDPNTINNIQRETYKTFDKAVANQLAVSDPNKLMDNLQAGKYTHLGVVEEATLKQKASAQFNAQLSTLRKEKDDIVNRIIEDKAMPSAVAQTINRAQALAQYHPEVKQEMDSVAKLQQFADIMRTKSIAEQREEQLTLSSHAQQDPNTPRDLYTNMHKVLKNNITAMQEDGLGYAVKHNLVNLPPLPADPSSPEGQQALYQRSLATAAAEKILGTPVVPLTQGEIDGIKTTLQAMPANEKMRNIGALASLDAGLAPRIAASLSKDGHSAALATALQVYNKNADVAHKILVGQELMGQGGQAKQASAEDRAAAAQNIKSLFPDDIATQNQLLNAADAYRAAIGDTTLDKKHVDAVTGTVKVGGMLGFGGYHTIPPKANMSGADFSHLIESLTQKELESYGNGAPIYSAGNPYDMSKDPLSGFVMQPADIYSGKYYLTKNGKALKTDNGSLYTIDLKKLVG